MQEDLCNNIIFYCFQKLHDKCLVQMYYCILLAHRATIFIYLVGKKFTVGRNP